MKSGKAILYGLAVQALRWLLVQSSLSLIWACLGGWNYGDHLIPSYSILGWSPACHHGVFWVQRDLQVLFKTMCWNNGQGHPYNAFPLLHLNQRAENEMPALSQVASLAPHRWEGLPATALPSPFSSTCQCPRHLCLIRRNRQWNEKFVDRTKIVSWHLPEMGVGWGFLMSKGFRTSQEKS